MTKWFRAGVRSSRSLASRRHVTRCPRRTIARCSYPLGMAPISQAARSAVKRALALGGISVYRGPNPLSQEWHVLELFARYQVDGVIDVGANRGQYGRRLREAGYEGPILSFEPVPEAFAELAAVSEHDPRWEARNIAVGDEPGTLSMNVAASTSVSSFLTPTAEYTNIYSGMEVQRQQHVSVVTLDTVQIPFQRPFLKTDTQGFDLRVMEGARQLLSKRVVGAQVELSVIPIYEGMPDFLAVIAKMRECGFTLTGMFSVQTDKKMRIYEFDGVFVRM
jgi:FkbM family methyltransferase